MATVNLGSIKFNWQGAYAGGTAYAVDDVVSYNGTSYVCILASTGNLPTNATYWNVMAEGGDVATTLTTQGDILYRDGSGLQRLGAGTSGQLLQSGGSGANVSWTDAPAGITNASQWRPTSNTTGSDTIISSWEKIDTNSPGYIGSDITLSNGGENFNFPSTGIWYINFNAQMKISGGASNYMGAKIQASSDGGSNFSDAAYKWDSGHSADTYGGVSLSLLFDVQNTSNYLIRAGTASVQTQTPVIQGSTTYNESSITFIRLGDT